MRTASAALPSSATRLSPPVAGVRTRVSPGRLSGSIRSSASSIARMKRGSSASSPSPVKTTVSDAVPTPSRACISFRACCAFESGSLKPPPLRRSGSPLRPTSPSAKATVQTATSGHL